MKYTNLHHINTLLQNSSVISDFCFKLEQLQQLQKIISNLLPPTIANHCTVANLREGVLVLATKSPAWKHQLNFLKIDLLEQLRNSSPIWSGIASIVITIDYLVEDLDEYKNNLKINNLNNQNNSKNFNQINVHKNFTISNKTAELVNSIIDQEISYQPLLTKLKQLIEKIRQLN